MYESFFGLTSKPFQLNPDPSFYFGSKQHRRASAYLEYGLHQNEGFIVVTGEVGAGKTTIVRGLLGKLDSSKVVAGQLVSTQLDAEDTLKLVAAAFGIKTTGQGKSEILMGLEAFLIGVFQQGKRCLLIVDEAQNLSQQSVEELRMLSNFQFQTQALLQTFLVGQPEFRRVMQSSQMQQLRQRVIAACHIGPMDCDETRAYISHRLKCAGYSGPELFDDAAYEGVFKASGGVPRRINTLCDRILLSGFLSDTHCFSLEDVEVVAREIYEETSGSAYFNKALESGEGQVNAVASDYLTDVLSSLDLDQNFVDEATKIIGDLRVQSNDQRLLRLERSMIRIESNSAAILNLLQQLLENLRTPVSQTKAVDESSV